MLVIYVSDEEVNELDDKIAQAVIDIINKNELITYTDIKSLVDNSDIVKDEDSVVAGIVIGTKLTASVFMSIISEFHSLWIFNDRDMSFPIIQDIVEALGYSIDDIDKVSELFNNIRVDYNRNVKEGITNTNDNIQKIIESGKYNPDHVKYVIAYAMGYTVMKQVNSKMLGKFYDSLIDRITTELEINTDDMPDINTDTVSYIR